MRYFEIEITDTFGGEANYSWVRRYRVKAKDATQALRRFTAEEGLQGQLRKDWSSGELTRYRVTGACMCVFVQERDEQEYKFLRGKEL